MSTNEQFPTAPSLNKRLIGGVTIGVAVLAIVGLAVANLKPAAIAAPANAAVVSAPTVEITETGFVPQNLKVKAGTTVRWINRTKSPHQVGSNPYPERTDLPGLFSPDPIAPGSAYTYTFEQAGSWGYNDPTQPTVGGRVTVE